MTIFYGSGDYSIIESYFHTPPLFDSNLIDDKIVPKEEIRPNAVYDVELVGDLLSGDLKIGLKGSQNLQRVPCGALESE